MESPDTSARFVATVYTLEQQSFQLSFLTIHGLYSFSIITLDEKIRIVAIYIHEDDVKI
jgi:hypothetical protein